MRYRIIPDILVRDYPAPITIHKIQQRVLFWWVTIGRVLTPEQAEIVVKILENKKG